MQQGYVVSDGCVEVFASFPSPSWDILPAFAVKSWTMSTTFTPMNTGPADSDPQPIPLLTEQPDELTMDTHLASVDPLATRPRRSSTLLTLILGAAMLLAAAVVWVAGARTVSGQTVDDMVWSDFHSRQPGWLASLTGLFAAALVVPIVSAVLALSGVVIALVRRRWLLLAQLTVFALVSGAAILFKGVLPREELIESNVPPINNAPSGQAIIVAAGAIVLLLAVPRPVRALCAAIGAAFTAVAALALVAQQVNRPSDVAMSLLLVSGFAMLLLAATRGSGMDAPGTRMSSASIQIVASVFITVGVIGLLYTAYLLWQIQPGIEFSAEWIRPAAFVSVAVGLTSLTLVMFGVLLALRQLTASPLSKIGLVGAPPTPPPR